MQIETRQERTGMTNLQEKYGKFISNHPYRSNSDIYKVLIPIFLAVFLPLMVYFGTDDTPYLITTTVMSILFAVIFTGRALPHGLMYLWKKPSVQLYEHGLLYRDRAREQFIDWESITDVRVIPIVLQSVIPEVSLRSGKRQLVRLTGHFNDAAELQYGIAKALISHREYHSQLEAGGTIQSGKLTLTHEGIRVKKRDIPWDQIHFAQCTNSFQTLTIRYDARKSVKLNMRKADNVPIIFTFIAEKVAANFNNSPEMVSQQ